MRSFSPAHLAPTALTTTLALALCVLEEASADTRYHQHSKKAKGSDGAVRLAGATFLGTPGVERIDGVSIEADGSVIASGNAWGARLPTVPSLEVVGPDNPVATSAYKDQARRKLDEDHPGRTGFVIKLSSDLGRILSGVRFGWGAATVTHMTTGPGGEVLVSGTSSPALEDALEGSATRMSVLSPPEGATSGGRNLYLASMSLNEARLEWIVFFREAEKPSAGWERRVGRQPGVHAEFLSDKDLVLVAYDRLYSMPATGGVLRELGRTRGGVLWAADPRDGSVYIGGDENTRTGREPWRRPFLSKFDRRGELDWEIWRWDSKRVGTDRYRLVSDSSVRHVLPGRGGDLVVAGWSDGGNSVFLREPRDLDREASYKKGFIDSLWGAGVGTFSRIMRLGPNQELRAATIWCSFLTSRNKPNSMRIDDMELLADGRVVVAGGSSSALVETPDAWVRKYPEGTGGAYVAIFSADLSDLLFATSLPGVRGKLAVAVRGSRIVVAGGALSPEGEEGPLLEDPLQRTCGGDLDGYILLAETSVE